MKILGKRRVKVRNHKKTENIRKTKINKIKKNRKIKIIKILGKWK